MLSTDQQSFDSTNPATGQVVGAVAAMDLDDVRVAVDAAWAVAIDFAGLGLRQRARHLREIRQSIVDRGEELASTIAAETGKPLPDAWLEVFTACALLTYAALAAPRVLCARSAPTWPVVTKSERWSRRPSTNGSSKRWSR